MKKISSYKFDRFYNGQEIQELVGEKPLTEVNIGFNHALNGEDWATAKAQHHPSEWNDYAGFFLKCEEFVKKGLLFFKTDGIAVKVMQDGSAFCCIGEGFVNLQESDNYAFGNTFDEAVENYKKKIETQI